MARKAVYTENDWPEVHDGDMLVTFVRPDESDSDAVLRAMELYRKDGEYFIKEV